MGGNNHFDELCVSSCSVVSSLQYFQSKSTVQNGDDCSGVTDLEDLISSGWMTHMPWASFLVQ